MKYNAPEFLNDHRGAAQDKTCDFEGADVPPVAGLSYLEVLVLDPNSAAFVPGNDAALPDESTLSALSLP